MPTRQKEVDQSSQEQRRSAYLVNHVFFPPQLPGGDDWDADLESHLLSTLRTCLSGFLHRVGKSQHAAVASALDLAVRTCEATGPEKDIDAEKLSAILEDMCQRDGAIALDICSQNAGVMISKKDRSVYIEAFELSLRNQTVMKSPGRLRRQFPDVAVSVTLDKLMEDAFRENLVHTLSILCQQPAAGTRPSVKKSSDVHDEERDTHHPMWVTEWLFSGVLGQESRPGGGQSIQKNVRDSILLDSKELKPWRRSRTWLLARVAVQLTFSRHSPEGQGIYKSFMLFFAATVLDEIPTRNLSSDHIAVMIAKVARRRHKLVQHGVGVEESWLVRYVDEAMDKATAELKRRQERILSLPSQSCDHPQLECLDPGNDVFHRLPAVDKFLGSIGTRTQSLPEAGFSRKSYAEEFEPGSLPSLPRCSSRYVAFTLAAFEKWVAEHLDSWIVTNASNPDTCRQLRRLLEVYGEAAKAEYHMNPEGGSSLVLTALELWIACDKSATTLEPLLRKYHPHVPAQLLQSLILPFRGQMSRLAKAELYLEERGRAANSSLPDIFQSFGVENSFAVQYYLGSQPLQKLHHRIVEDATGAKKAKVAELHRLQSRYRDLKARYDTLSCEYVQVWNSQSKKHLLQHIACRRCKLKQQMDGVKICIHEWPLPLAPHAGFATVFELRPPHHFSAWREATALLLLDVLDCRYKAGAATGVEDHLGQYKALSVYAYPRGAGPRITLASSTKPNARTHRKSKHVLGLAEHDVCLNNGMTWAYYDSAKAEYTDRFEFDEERPRRCLYSLASETRWLEKYLFRPSYRPQGLDPNQAIANQHETPDSMSVPEYNGLASVLSQHKLQWMNILCEAASPCIDFRKDETSVVLFQAMYQAGPPTKESDLREGHKILNDAEFCHKLVTALHEAAGRIKQNWESSQALANFVFIASRALALSSNPGVHRACLGFLREARSIACNWLKLVRAKAQSITDNDFRLELFGKIAEIALICVATFDVEERHLQPLLSGLDDASILVQCFISCQECLAPGDLRPQGTLLSLMILRWKRVCSRARAHLTDLFTVEGFQENALDNAIHKSWPEYSKSGRWKPLARPLGHWLETATAPIHGRSLKVMYNLLTAELLVNGLPLSRLPREYEGYRLYRQLFGNAILDVMPTNVPGMQFGLKAKVSGYTVSMGLSDSYGLLVCATHCAPETTTYHIVPEDCFRGFLPASFVEDYTHWYNAAKDIVEFRPAQSSWKRGEEALRDGWTLSRKGAGTWELRKRARLLVSRGSRTEKEISKVLQPIEDTDYLHVCHDETQAHSNGLDIEVPRLRLQFSLHPEPRRLISRQFRGMWVDPVSPSFGALMGLRSKLMLVNSRGSRMVLVPDGEITWARAGKAANDPEGIGHVSVHVTKGTSSTCRAYQVDTELGRLVDDGSFRGKIYLAYLHALTSYPIPDPLTAHTGTEQALSILRSAAVRSLFRPSEPDLELLVLISRLTPIRTFYPDHSKVMQRVQWFKDIGFLAQHSQLRLSVKALLEQADLQAALRNPDSRADFVGHLPRLTESLLKYDLVASAWCRTSGFGAEDFTTAHDRTYSDGRGCNWNAARANACFDTSGIILRNRPCLSTALQHGLLQSILWRCFLPAGAVKGPMHPLPSFDHDGVDFTWLHENNTVLHHVCRLHLVLSGGAFSSRHRVMSWLSSMVFAANVQVRSSTERLFELPILRMLEAFIVAPEMAHITPPSLDSFPVNAGHEFVASAIKNLAENGARDYHECPESSLPRHARESDLDLSRRRTTAYQAMVEGMVAELVSFYRRQWPCYVPTPPSEARWRTYFDMGEIQGKVQDRFASWFANHLFYGYLGKIAQVMVSLPVIPPAVAREPHVKFASNSYASIKGFVSADDIFRRHEPPQVSLLGPGPSLFLPEEATAVRGSHEAAPARVKGLVRRIQQHAKSDFEKRYADDLERSADALGNHLELPPIALQSLGQIQEALRIYSSQCRSYRKALHEALEAASSAFGRHSTASLPRICAQFFLSQLAVSRWKTIPASWKPALIRYGLAHHDVLRAERLLALISPSSLNDLAKEMRNTPHQNWTPEEYPFALLMEVESNITIRKVQIDIARQMIDPPDGRNSVMQLNMGEGKSTVIVPTVAAAEVANGDCLVRVIVAKAQAPQMRQMLLSKLGGLLDVRIHQLPFSRELRLDAAQVSSIARDLRACRDGGGVLLVQPEHLLSFKLMGLEFLINGKTSISRELIQTQCFLESTSRDIVDESDENFSVKFELVYTMGTQRPIDFSPDRWHLLLNVLAVVKDVAPAVVQEMPRSCAISNRNGAGSFPRLRVFTQEAQNCLARAVAQRICDTGLPGLPIARQGDGSRAALFTYMTKQDLTPEEIAAVEIPGARSFWSESTKRPLLLLRGLLAGGVLGFVFSKRWRVNYGLDQGRNPPTRLAVPYRAKDCPSARSEFSHPEVVMLLTALSSYYGGLSDDELFLAFTHLLKSDQPEQDYDEWVRDADSMPSSFRHLNGVNIKDHGQCTQQIFPSLRYSKGAIDFFLSRVVYPKFMKEFPSKLSASGWDLGEEKVHPTTGFSGTNDSRELLPLSVRHLDLPEQKHTNGLVLEYLLRDENSVVSIPPRRGSSASDAELLLDLVVNMSDEVQVILDVGAQILELGNAEVAKQWLKMETEVNSHRGMKACVFVNDKDELHVVDLKGHTEPLQTSPFYHQLDVCLVFLDEAHTRGTDLKLPDHYRAALTLGANLTKDRLAQAAMRMRKLGKGQSITFCVPQEIETMILQQRVGIDSIEVMDVLEWAIQETILDYHRSIPLWAVQGLRYAHQKSIYCQTGSGEQMTQDVTSKLLEDEAQTINDLYRPGERVTKPCCPEADRHPGVDRILEHCAKFGGSVNLASAALHEEQERELSPEIEQERHVEKPKPAEPAPHQIDGEVRHFVRTGKIPAFSGVSHPCFPSAWMSLARTSAAAALGVHEFPADVLTTRDFARTIQTPISTALGGAKTQLDQYQRAVRWILTSTRARGHHHPSDEDGTVRTMVLISPFEAQDLLKEIAAHGEVVLHIYAPRSTMGFRPLDHLLLHARPTPPPTWTCPLRLKALLNVFAGQLFMSSHDEYKAVCGMFGLDWKGGLGDGVFVHPDGFIDPASREEAATGTDGNGLCAFTQSPVPFLKVLMTKIRRDCESIDKTHIGMMLNGIVLREEDFESPESPSVRG
ncbi:hypothetical protein MAPG_05168 [Magnaporthiopsis poae ATCC 64411]|uniref:ubiquitinyl hydrolase 1 n=1 Tax=Magnaporthiopsis poae (strain ATCC 64411 / 73-15) TaxID=644358 RepID=A0A0C4DYP2_MAGP6|nr:hypothetical protein MAPG_05168 [Magnaporthiopsis poae ATCC 64411]